MRIFQNFAEATNEVKRDLAEMGIDVHPQTMQDKNVANDDNYATKELQNYIYTVVDAVKSIDQLTPVQPWADAEFDERVAPYHVNPGDAYGLRPDVWNEFLHDGEFAYTYNERMVFQLNTLIEELKTNPDSRQLYLSIWNPRRDIKKLGGQSRVPCSLGYLFQLREGKLNMTYFMRSCDFVTHFQNDVYLAVKLLQYVAEESGNIPGNFTHYMGSLHIYKKDTEGVF